MHFFLEYAVFFVVVAAIIAIILLFTMTGRKSSDAMPMDDAHHGGDLLSGDTAGTSAAMAGASASAADAEPSETEQAISQDSGAVAVEPKAVEAPVETAPAPVPAPAAAPAPVAQAPAAKTDASATDDLLLLKGVGPKLKDRLNELGVTGYGQIAGWSDADVQRIDGELGTFKGRIQRDNWIDQAKLLAAGDKAGFEAKYGALGK